MSKRNIIISVVLACLLVTGAGFGAFYYWGTHHLDSVVPGKVYQYSSSLNGEVNNRVMYVAFQEGGNKALVSQDRTTVVNAAKSQTDFDKAYNDQTAKWEYSVTKTTLTLGKKEDDQLSQWQYNKVFAYGDHFTSKDFYFTCSTMDVSFLFLEVSPAFGARQVSIIDRAQIQSPSRILCTAIFCPAASLSISRYVSSGFLMAGNTRFFILILHV